MSAAARQARSALATIRREGELVTIHQPTGAPVVLPCLITRRSEPVLSNGKLRFNEGHSLGMIAASTLTGRPMQGDRITTAQDIYRVDAPADAAEGLWTMILRSEPLPTGTAAAGAALLGPMALVHVTEPVESKE